MNVFIFTCQFAGIACAVVGGVFLTFSDFLMRSLERSDPVAGIEVMQRINREVMRTVFIAAFLGLAGGVLPAGELDGFHSELKVHERRAVGYAVQQQAVRDDHADQRPEERFAS